MSREPVEVVRRAYEAFSRGDLEGLFADAAPEFEYVATWAIPAPVACIADAASIRRVRRGSQRVSTRSDVPPAITSPVLLSPSNPLGCSQAWTPGATLAQPALESGSAGVERGDGDAQVSSLMRVRLTRELAAGGAFEFAHERVAQQSRADDRMDEEQARSVTVLLLDGCESGAGADRSSAKASLSSRDRLPKAVAYASAPSRRGSFMSRPSCGLSAGP
jgi:hypothetical protein